jgi:hypothetical protein
MGKKRKSGQVPARGGNTQSPSEPESEPQELSYEEERFVEEYVSNGGNATLAAKEAGYSHHSARWRGYEILKKSYIQKALETERDAQRELIRIDKTKVLRTLAGMAFASLDNFTDLFDDPSKKPNYRKLGFKRFALDSAKKRVSYDEDGNPVETNEIKIISAGERRAALNDLWERCGLGSAPSGDRGDSPEAVLAELRKLIK